MIDTWIYYYVMDIHPATAGNVRSFRNNGGKVNI